MQQRGISAATLDALLEFGRLSHAGGGRDIVFFENARARLVRDVLPGSEADRACNSYAIVESDGAVITVGPAIAGSREFADQD